MNKFGQTKPIVKKSSGGTFQRGPPGVGFKLTVDGNYDMGNKRLLNIDHLPRENNEVASKIYVDILNESMKDEWVEFEEQCKVKLENLKQELLDYDTHYKSMLNSIHNSLSKNVKDLQVQLNNLSLKVDSFMNTHN